MSNDKILIDRAVVERAYQLASNEDQHDLMQALDVALAASPAAPETDNVAYLKSDIKARDAVLSIQDKRIAELAAELLGLRTQEPVMVLNYDGVPEWMASQWGGKRTPGTMFYAAAGAQENSK